MINKTEKNENIQGKKIDVNNKNPKVNRVESLKSNIFNSDFKQKENINSQPNFKTEKDERPNVNTKKIVKSDISTVFDWKNTNTEIVFKKRNSDEKFSPAVFKRRNLMSELDDNKVKKCEYDTSNVNIDNDNVIQKKEISNIMEERYGTNHSRMKKNLDSVSQLQNPESVINYVKSKFINNLVNKKDRQTESFSVENIKNFDSLNINMMKGMYAKIGYIHK